MQRKLTRREFGKIILPTLPLIAMPRLALAAADKWMGMDVTKIKAINGLGVGSIKNQNGVALATAALTCQSYTANSSADTTEAIFRYATEEYYGMIFDDGSSGQICGLDLFVWDMPGTPADLDLYAEVWLLGASDVLSSLVQRSSKVDGAAWSQQLVEFTFPTPANYDCTGSNQYGLLFKAVSNDDPADTAGKVSATNYSRTRHYAAGNTMNHCVALAKWNKTTMAITTKQTGRMPYMTVRTMQ